MLTSGLHSSKSAQQQYLLRTDEWAADGSFGNAQKAVGIIAAAGFPKAKVNMGVAFYLKGGDDYCSAAKGCKGAAACRNCTAPESNTCGGALFDGADMQRAMGRWVVANGFGGVLIFQVNYDRDNYLLNALGEGLLAAT